MKKTLKVILFSILYIWGIISFLSVYKIYVAVATLLLLLFFHFYKNFISKKLFILFSFAFILGFVNTGMHIQYYDGLNAYDNENVKVIAKVVSIPTNNIEGKTKFYAKVFSVQDENGEIKNIKAKSFIRVIDEGEKLKKINIGNTLELKGILKVPHLAANPSQFDYPKYLQYKNTFSLLYVNYDWKIIRTSDNLKDKFLQRLNNERSKILNIHAENIKAPMIQILGGIIFGDDAVNPDEETKENFINSGIFHILAASGMNVTLIFGIWYFFARNLRFNYRFSIICGILLISFYTCMTGFGPPIVRAFLMLTLILIGKFIDRKTSTISLLFAVGFIMLLANPLMLFDIGFQMSFIVTFALILTSPLLTFNFKYKFLNYIAGACLIPVIAQFYAAPIQMFYFNTFSLYSVLANIAIIPVLSIISFLGFISSIVAMIPIIAHKICAAADVILNPLLVYVVKVAEFFSNLPLSIIYVKKPSITQIFLYFVVIITLTLLYKYKVKSKKIIISALIPLVCFALSFISFPSKYPEIIFFAVGNADMIMLKSPNNDYFILDTGKAGFRNFPTQAKNIILKYMQDRGIHSVNSLILTHYDSDHAGGTIDILEKVKVKTVYNSEVFEDTDLSDNITNYIKRNKINAVNVSDNIEIYNKDDFKLSVIKPKGKNIISENQRSLIVHCSYKKNNILFMGDGDVNSYNSIEDRYKTNLTVLKIGHHGGLNTFNKTMSDNSKMMVISTGRNIYNHPHPSILQVIKDNNSLLYRTDLHNAIKLILKEDGAEVLLFSPLNSDFIKINTIP